MNRWGLLCLLAGAALAAQRPGRAPTGTSFRRGEIITPAMERAVAEGLAWLARQANRDGSFGSTRARIAVTALSALSFMAGGSTATRGPYREEVRRAIRYLLDHVSEEPPYRGYIYLPEDAESRMHGHGYATLALAEALGTYGAGDAERFRALKRGLTMAVRLIERTQTEAGGWYYHPENDGNHEGSITVCMLQALRAARNAGIYVQKRVIDRAVAYIRKSAYRDARGRLTGAFQYSLVDPQTSFALTAASVATLHMCGAYDSPYVALGLGHMDRELEDHLARGRFYYYGLLYAVQAYFQAGGGRWQRSFPRIRDALLANRIDPQVDPENGGAFQPHVPSEEQEYGFVYATAMATLTLQIPYRFLPIFQR